MKSFLRFNIRTIILLTIAVAMLTVVGVHRYSQYLEVRRQEVLRLDFRILEESIFLHDSIRGQIIQDPDVARALQKDIARVPRKDGSDLPGGWQRPRQLGADILVPQFAHRYEYYWLREQADWEQKPFQLTIRSALHPSTMKKPLIRFQTQGTELESKVVDWVIEKLDLEKVDIVREVRKTETSKELGQHP